MKDLASFFENGTAWEPVGQVCCAFDDMARRRAQWRLHARYLLWVMSSRPSDAAWSRAKRFPHGVVLDALEFAEPGGYLSPLQRQRCEEVARALREQRSFVADLLAPLKPEDVSSTEFDFFLESQNGQMPVLWKYVFNLFRDWSWGDKENERAFQSVVELLGGRAPGSVLVPGAGAGRLAYDIHNRLRPAATCAVDIDPLLSLCAARLFAGQTIVLYEFPSHPLDLSCTAVLRELRAPLGASRDGLEFVMADVAERKLRRRSYDVVVTHWIIDVVDLPLNYLFALINEVLVVGGTWINLGPALFRSFAPDMRSVDEVLEAVPEAGFRLEDSFVRFEPYLISPASATHRSERVLGFRATKTRDVDVPEHISAGKARPPSWLVDTSVPVAMDARLEEFAAAHRATAEILVGASKAMSIAEISAEVANKFGLALDVATQHAQRTLRPLTRISLASCAVL